MSDKPPVYNDYTDITTLNYKIRSEFDAELIAGFIKGETGKY